MSKKRTILLWIFILCLINPIFGQVEQKEFDAFVQPVGAWVKAGKVQMDALKPEILIFESGSDCIINGVNGSAKYLVTKKEYQDIECHIEFMLPKGSNSGIYFMCRYEIQLFDSWGASELSYYDCGGIQQGMYNSQSGNEMGFDGFAPMSNACKPPGEWQSLDVVFIAPKINSKGDKVKNAMFEKVILNGVVVQENAELSGPTKGALSETEVALAPFRLQGGHGPVAFREIKVRELGEITDSKPNKWENLFVNKD